MHCDDSSVSQHALDLNRLEVESSFRWLALQIFSFNVIYNDKFITLETILVHVSKLLVVRDIASL